MIQWLFDGLGTMLLGLVVGAGAGGAAGWTIRNRTLTQRQRAKDNATQIQAGRNVR